MSALAGLIGQRVMLERPDPARDAIGGATGAWIGEGPAWAGIAPVGRDAWRVMLRTPCPVEAGWRLAWGARRLIVRDVTADPRTPDHVVLAAEEQR